MKGFGMIGSFKRGILGSKNKIVLGRKVIDKGLKLGCLDVIKDMRLEEGLL